MLSANQVDRVRMHPTGRWHRACHHSPPVMVHSDHTPKGRRQGNAAMGKLCALPVVSGIPTRPSNYGRLLASTKGLVSQLAQPCSVYSSFVLT